jgi:cellobiose phosphorylase
VATHWILGIRPQTDGLLVDPSIPAYWPGFKVTRKFRNATYKIEVKNPQRINRGINSITIDGKSLEGELIPVFNDGQVHDVQVIMGKPE